MGREYDFTKARRGPVLPASTGKTRITIRLDDDVLNWFRSRVHASGRGSYQSLINRALHSFMQSEAQPLEETVRSVVREELRRHVKREDDAEVGKTSEYRTSVRARHSEAFALHRQTTLAFESAICSAHASPTVTHVAVDMLMLQAHKSHLSVALLAEHGLVEDAATITRRLLELSVQGAFIMSEQNAKSHDQVAGRYLLRLWQELPDKVKARLPKSTANYWEELLEQHMPLVATTAKRWGPTFKDMFTAIDALDLHDQDYAFLSSIAHGSHERLIVDYSKQTIPVPSHEPTSVLLVYASRYYAALGGHWNTLFGAVHPSKLGEVVDSLTNWERS